MSMTVLRDRRRRSPKARLGSVRAPRARQPWAQSWNARIAPIAAPDCYSTRRRDRPDHMNIKPGTLDETAVAPTGRARLDGEQRTAVGDGSGTTHCCLSRRNRRATTPWWRLLSRGPILVLTQVSRHSLRAFDSASSGTGCPYLGGNRQNKGSARDSLERPDRHLSLSSSFAVFLAALIAPWPLRRGCSCDRARSAPNRSTPRPTRPANGRSGFLLLTLAITPLRRIAECRRLIHVRRMVGVAAFRLRARPPQHSMSSTRSSTWAAWRAEIAVRFCLTIGFAGLRRALALLAAPPLPTPRFANSASGGRCLHKGGLRHRDPRPRALLHPVNDRRERGHHHGRYLRPLDGLPVGQGG